jgi:Spy/CpxP family protein refolding chaperone
MKSISLMAALVISTSALAQTAPPYAGLQSRSIKALSDQQLSDLHAGRGAGLALAAELNGYPGPAHVLELADKLSLSPAQRERAQTLFAAMKAEAVPLGEQLIAREEELDRLFASRTVTATNLVAATQAIGDTQAALRATHLKYHLSMTDLLSPKQVQHYSVLRGYGGGEQMPHPHHQH